ncbi:hypothetical protein HK105_207763 [Polyrhizophydium stewartii]|uniref:Tubulin delta chain n=1 Tax=Polyrhizophydium stewartii TaxID=2732419 RepID=A0ABR4MZT1_9FUNG|nr:hypothetical protein HK105_007048 [Polyrhizophydium stewartii]
MISLQVGQCGVQVGQALFGVLAEESRAASPAHALYPLSLWQQLVVDTERKVLAAADAPEPPQPPADTREGLQTWRRHQRADAGMFATKYLDLGTSGRGNNWSHGYLDDSRLDEVLEAFRRLAEASFRYEGCMLLHSLAGGTGSGLGSRLAQELRTEYPKQLIMSLSFAPFDSGETALQDYNGLLTLASLQNCADLVGVFPNDLALRNAARHLGVGSSSGSTRISMDQINQLVAQSIAGIVLPLSEALDIKLADRTTAFSGWDLVTNVTPMPSTKLAMFASSSSLSPSPDQPKQQGSEIDTSKPLRKVARPTHEFDSWDDLHTLLNRNLPALAQGKKRCCIGARLNIRGVQGPEFWSRWPAIRAKWAERMGPTLPDCTTDVRLSYLYGLDIHSKRRSLDLCYNSDDVLPIVERILAGAERKFKQRAYVHWYERYAREHTDDMFGEAFETVQSVVDAYRDLSHW